MYVLDQIVKTITVSDFQMLFSKSNMLQLIVFSVLFGLATAMAGEKAKGIAKFVEEGGVVIGIVDENKVPVKFIGVGEKIEDLEKFNSDEFLDAII